MQKTINFVGGPADGQQRTDGPLHVPVVMVPVLGKYGFAAFRYTLRNCRDIQGNIVQVLAPAGRNIDPAYLAANNLTN